MKYVSCSAAYLQWAESNNSSFLVAWSVVCHPLAWLSFYDITIVSKPHITAVCHSLHQPSANKLLLFVLLIRASHFYLQGVSYAAIWLCVAAS